MADDLPPVLVRTLYLANFREAAVEVAHQRRKPRDMDTLRNALKKLDMADKALQVELNNYASQGYEIVSLIEHQVADYPMDLLVTAVFIRR